MISGVQLKIGESKKKKNMFFCFCFLITSYLYEGNSILAILEVTERTQSLQKQFLSKSQFFVFESPPIRICNIPISAVALHVKHFFFLRKIYF